MSRGVVLLQATQSTPDLGPLLASQHWRLRRAVHPEQIRDALLQADCHVGIAVFDNALGCSPGDLADLVEDSGMEWVAVRSPLVYGPGVRANFLALMRAVARGLPLPMGSIRNSRSMVSVYNLNDFIACALDHSAAAGNRFFAADAEDVSTPELVRAIARSLNCRARLLPISENSLRAVGVILGRRAAVQRLCSSLTVDREKARVLLGWTAPVPLDISLRHTAEWFSSRGFVGSPHA